MAEVMYYCLEVSEFKLLSYYYVQLQTNTFGKITYLLIPSSCGFNRFPALSNKDGFGIKQSTKVDMPLNKEKKNFDGWLVGVLWHINPCGLFNAKSLYIYIYIYIYNFIYNLNYLLTLNASDFKPSSECKNL